MSSSRARGGCAREGSSRGRIRLPAEPDADAVLRHAVWHELDQQYRGLAQRIDYSQYGGAPLLGVDGGYVIGHGRSGPEAFRNGLKLVRTYVLGDVGARIVEELREAAATTSSPEATAEGSAS